ncbi:NADPH:quinone oxidoreductase family protein [Aurantimonas sp. VKM B-3413]|uniref:NADPH:quinone oxidoreductase family protein n=1 Tax=Aurantimonas sp. VKM B-3413 TaxID=2779401 RepID=UPI001E38F1C0|nr:NADPH:quinone oxidoreductase family protein [Aurantimonas sp. VKM B-3413]MCB8837632.1 NADPH:quinone oxidoreductase family protein [Aurantimonas sp. VKM B-3413]
MKAVLCEAYGPIADLALREMPDPEATGDAVVIRTEAIGVNYPDGLLVQGLYQAKPNLPFVPGMEAAGEVTAVGPEVTRFSPGDRVVALLDHGGYAERVAAPERAVMALPEGLDAGEACALLCAYGTAHYALKQRAELKPGETVLVLGAAGSTGLAACQIANAMGARVIGVASSEEKQGLAVAQGADVAIGYEDLREDIRRLTDGKGIDVAFDPVGGEAFDAVSRGMAWGGRLLVIGFASGTIPKLAANLALVKGYSLVGVFWGAFTRREPEVFAANMEELFAWAGEGVVTPEISERVPLAEAADVLARIHARTTTGKIVLVP